MRLVCLIGISLASAALIGCSHQQSSSASVSRTVMTACHGDPYLMRYNCSIDRVLKAAENGDPDAEYALGYMYYYGINTAQDVDSAKLWIARAAAQGQPLAKRSMQMIEGGTHPAKHAHRRVKAPIEHHLPNYGAEQHAAKVAAKKPVIDALHRKEPTLHSEKAAAATVTANPSYSAVAKSTAAVSKSHTVKPAAAKATSEIKQMESLLMHAPKNGYTLQLMGNHHLSVLKSFVRRNHLEKNSKYYFATFHKSPWYMLTYGQYKTVNDAHKAIASLPKSLRKLSPWIKPMRSVQAEIETRSMVS